MGKYRSKGTQWIDPRRVQTRVRSESAVRGYVENPNWSGPDFFGNNGSPSVIRNPDGSIVADQGNHRIEAAKRARRKIKVEVYEPTGQESKRDSFFAWMWGG